jgi:2-oxoglutarate ferredoxin oxidoreductase subunit gamma
MKKIEVRISGLGGQGVVLAGQILGRATVYSGRNAVQTQSYGAEARGSAAKSEVIISDDKIGFSAVRKCDILIAMSQEAVEKNIKDLKEDSILLVDSSIAKKVPETKARIFKIPATEIAEKIFKAKICVNMIMLGALANITKIANEKSFTRAIKETVSTEAINVNLRAYRKGLALTL